MKQESKKDKIKTITEDLLKQLNDSFNLANPNKARVEEILSSVEESEHSSATEEKEIS
jgi:hypothetical protein